MNGFSEFWNVYPHRVGKIAAEKAFSKALKSATAEQIIDGVRYYKRTKPDWQSWAYPKTWLSQGRWLDEVPSRPTLPEWSCPHDPPCLARHACYTKSYLEANRAES